MRKHTHIDRSDRLYQMPQPIADFFPKPAIISGRKGAIIDLARPRWGAQNNNDPEANETGQAEDSQISEIKVAVAEWASRELSVKINPEREVFIAESVRELLALIGMAYLDPGDLALYPNPGYPVFRQTILTYGAEPLPYQLTEKRDFKLRLKQFSEKLGRAARALFLNNPHNPTGATLDMEELDELLWTSAKANLLVINDAAYFAFGGCEDVSLMGSPSGRRFGLELYNLSYLSCRGATPIAFALGSKELIASLGAAASVRGSKLQSGSVQAAQQILNDYPGTDLHFMRSKIRDAFPEAIKLCEALKLTPVNPEGFPYLLARVPRRTSSQAFAATMMRRFGIVSLPGIAFGDMGEGYLRFSLTLGPFVYQEALARALSRKLKTG